MGQNQINEKLLQWVWKNQNFDTLLYTTNGIKIEIISPGILSLEDGPDFRGAQIKFNNNIVCGDIELHLLSSDWVTHSHQLDLKYNNVILHVVWDYDSCDAITQEKRVIPTLNLSKYVLKSSTELLKEYKREIKSSQKYRCKYAKNYNRIMAIMETEGINRFNERKQKFNKLINFYGLEQATYIGVMESLGYVKNETAFVRLANLVTIKKLSSIIANKPRSDKVKIIKTSLLGVADLVPWKFRSYWNKIRSEFNKTMKKEEWQFFKVRPSAFPNRRIEGISYFLADTIESGIYNFFKENIYDLNKIVERLAQGKISKSCARTTVLNVCLPILAIYEENILQIYRNYKRLPENSITKLMSKTLFRDKKRFNTEIYYQGMIHIYHHYCHNKQCDACPIACT